MTKLTAWLTAILRSEDLDLHLLLVCAAAATVAGLLGVPTVGTQVFVSVLFALLALLALSQIRSRVMIRGLSEKQSNLPDPKFLTTLPSELDAWRCSAPAVLMIGGSQVRATYALRRCIDAKLASGHRIRIAFLDPQVSEVINQGKGRQHTRIQAGIEDLATYAEQYPDQVQVRTVRTPPAFSYSVLEDPAGLSRIVLQHRGWKSSGDGQPVFVLSEDQNGVWFQRFRAEAERIWEASTPISPNRRAGV